MLPLLPLLPLLLLLPLLPHRTPSRGLAYTGASCCCPHLPVLDRTCLLISFDFIDIFQPLLHRNPQLELEVVIDNVHEWAVQKGGAGLLDMIADTFGPDETNMQLRYAAMALINACIPPTAFEGGEGLNPDASRLQQRCLRLADKVRWVVSGVVCQILKRVPGTPYTNTHIRACNYTRFATSCQKKGGVRDPQRP